MNHSVITVVFLISMLFLGTITGASQFFVDNALATSEDSNKKDRDNSYYYGDGRYTDHKKAKIDHGYNDNDNYDKFSYKKDNHQKKVMNQKKYDNNKKDLEKKETINNKVITTDSNGNIICAIILDNIQNANSTINISDFSMCNSDVGQQDGEPTDGGLLKITKDWFVCDNEGIDCTIVENQEIQGFEGPDSGMYSQCISEQDCPFANDASFEIEINGNSPTPTNTIPAQIGVMQDIEIDTGPFEVSELLFSDEIVRDAFIDVIDIDLLTSGGDRPTDIVFEPDGQRVFTANSESDSVSIIELDNANNVIDVDLSASGGEEPDVIAFDPDGQRVFTANQISDSVSIIELPPTISEMCQTSGFDTGDIRTFVSNGQTIEQITCVIFVGECSGNIQDGETKECTVQNYAVKIMDSSDEEENAEDEMISSSITQQQQQEQQQQKPLLQEQQELIQQQENKNEEKQNLQTTSKSSSALSDPSIPFILSTPSFK